LADFLKSSDYGQLPFLRLWGIEVFLKRPDMLGDDEAFDLAMGFTRELGTRPAAMMARRGRRLDWIRGLKDVDELRPMGQASNYLRRVDFASWREEAMAWVD
jgi:hypothetical protein